MKPLQERVVELRHEEAKLQEQVGVSNGQLTKARKESDDARAEVESLHRDIRTMDVALQQAVDDLRKTLTGQLATLEMANSRLKDIVRRDFLPASENSKLHNDRLAELEALRDASRTALAGGNLPSAQTTINRFAQRTTELERTYYGNSPR